MLEGVGDVMGVGNVTAPGVIERGREEFRLSFGHTS
jgi:hypothetical protein